MTTIETKITPKLSTTEQTEFGIFHGTYRSLAKSAFNGCVNYFDATPAQAHKLGLSLMADWGNHQAQKRAEVEATGGNVTGKYGKEGKDGEITLKSVQEIESTGKASDSIRIGLIIQNLDKVQKGLVYQTMKANLVKELHEKLFGPTA
jgi:hypothetical protein